MDLLPSSVPHWHLFLNHFPSIGTLIALGLFLAAYYWKSEDLIRASLALFLIMTLLAIPTFITGHASAFLIRDNPNVSAAAISVHMEMALIAFCVLGITGMLSWFALWQYRRYDRPSGLTMGSILVFALLSLFFMALTGSAGGHINHPEIWPAGAVEVQPGPGPTVAIVSYVHNNLWMWPALEVVHFLGMALLFGTVLFVCLRALGLAKSVPYSAVHRIMPLGVFGFAVNVATGMVFYMAETGLFVGRPVGMYPKMALVVIGGIAIIYFTIFDRPWKAGRGEGTPLTAKAFALVTLFSWAGVLLLGRLLPYLEGL